MFFIDNIVYWTDYIEILFCSGIIYWFSCWLAADQQKNILGYFYLYCFVVAIAYTVPLPTIQYFLFYATPLLCIFVAVTHQDILQKKFISFTSISYKREHNVRDIWISDIVRASLFAQHHHKHLCVLIEHKQSLASMVHTDFCIETTIQLWILHMVIQNEKYDDAAFVWINSAGQLKGINTVFIADIDPLWLPEHVQDMPVWQQQALFCSIKTDALCLYYDQHTGNFNLMCQGKYIYDIPTQKVSSTLQNILRHTAQEVTQQFHVPEHSYKKSHHEQTL